VNGVAVRSASCPNDTSMSKCPNTDTGNSCCLSFSFSGWTVSELRRDATRRGLLPLLQTAKRPSRGSGIRFCLGRTCISLEKDREPRNAFTSILSTLILSSNSLRFRFVEYRCTSTALVLPLFLPISLAFGLVAINTGTAVPAVVVAGAR
jgi:hypothetical protein